MRIMEDNIIVPDLLRKQSKTPKRKINQEVQRMAVSLKQFVGTEFFLKGDGI
jgi:hypothetical protein